MKGASPYEFVVESDGDLTAKVLVPATFRKESIETPASINTEEERKEEEPQQKLTHIVTITCESLSYASVDAWNENVAQGGQARLLDLGFSFSCF